MAFEFLSDAWDEVKKVAPYVFPVPYAANWVAAHLLGIGGDDIPAPEKIPAAPPPPDFTDAAVRAARLSARRRALSGAGMSSTFLSGPLGDPTDPLTRTPTLTGV